MLIRELKPSDFDDITEMYFSFFPEAEADPKFGLTLRRVKPTMEDERKWFSDMAKQIEEGNAVVMVAEVDSRVVGYCGVERRVPGSPVDHRGDFGISMRKEFRGRGIGTALINGMIEKCRGKFEILELNVFASNPGAFALYKRLGFKEYGILPQAIKRSGIYIDERMMYLKL